MILKNGKRIDGCTDTLPVGTVQPFLGLTPPLGYLVCQGQMVSKAEYPELYKVCLSAFGIETNTHFYLPDLRGKTLAGYDENDAAMNTIGKLLGQKTHVHTTGNHTLTVAEMPTHQHRTQFSWIDSAASGSEWGYVVKMNRDGKTDGGAEEFIGGSQPHNHGDTGGASNYQPTITINWIVKAAMLIPEYFKVENTLTSISTNNALSAAQGKILNDKVSNCLSRSGGTVSGDLISYYHDFLISANEFNFTPGSYNNGSIYFNYRAGTSNADKTAGPITNYYFYNGQKEMATNVYAKYFQSTNGTLLGTNNFYVITGTTSAPDSGGNAELTNVPSDVYVIALKPTSNINATIVPYYPGNGYDHWFMHVIESYGGTTLTSISYAALVYKPS